EFQTFHNWNNAFSEVIQNIAEGIGQINDNYTVTFCNQLFASIFGKLPHDVVGQNLLQVINHQENVLSNEQLSATLLRQHTSVEIKFTGINQQDKYILLRTIPKINRLNQYTGSLVLLSDITDRVSIEHDLVLSRHKAQETEHLKAAFLANVPHEIRTPMNSIMGFASILK